MDEPRFKPLVNALLAAGKLMLAERGTNKIQQGGVGLVIGFAEIGFVEKVFRPTKRGGKLIQFFISGNFACLNFGDDCILRAARGDFATPFVLIIADVHAHSFRPDFNPFALDETVLHRANGDNFQITTRWARRR
ncbi:MAG TPA: hypothetical protein VIK53_16910 [Verrucomicrobiae bacterium]